eukprot:787167_1
MKFKQWLFDTVKLKQYLKHFKQNEANDVRMIEFFDEDSLTQDIGIKNRLHCKLVLKKAMQFKQSQMKFNQMLDDKQLNKYKDVFEARGILRLQDLDNVKTRKDLGKVLDVVDEECVNILWIIIHSEDAVTVVPDNEGQKTLCIGH